MPPTTKLDIKKAIKARLKGQSVREIAAAQGVSKSAVWQTLKPLLKDLPSAEELATMNQTLGDHFAVTAYRTVASITDEDIAKSSLRDKAVASGILLDKSRLIKGLSTSNSAIIMASAVIEADGKVSNTDE